MDAIIALGAVLFAGSLGAFLFGFRVATIVRFGTVLGMTVAQMLAFVAGVYAISAASMPVAQVRLSFGTGFSASGLRAIDRHRRILAGSGLASRALAPDHVPGGPSCDHRGEIIKPILLLVIGGVAAFLVSLVTMPFVITMFRFF